MIVALVVKLAAAALRESQPLRDPGMPVLFDLTAVLTHGQRCQEKVHHLLTAVYALMMLVLHMVARKT